MDHHSSMVEGVHGGVDAGESWTELQDALVQARANLLRYQELFDFAPDGYVVTDLRGIILQVNHAAAALLGTRKEFLVDKPLLFYVAETDQPTFARELHQIGRGYGWREQWELMLRGQKGAPTYVLVSTAASTDPDSSIIRWTFRDVTAWKDAEQALYAEKNFTDSLVELAEAVIVVLDRGCRIQDANPFLCGIVGRTLAEVQNKPFTDFLVPEDGPSFQDAYCRPANSSGLPRGVHRLRARDGMARAIAWSSRPLVSGATGPRTLLVGSDITELQRAQQQAAHTERLASIGQMVAGLAHESRNALQRIQSCVSVLTSKLADRPMELDLLARIQKAQDDIVSLYDEVREFAAPAKLDRQPCQLRQVWREAWENLASVLTTRKAELHEEIVGNACECPVDAFRLRQVFRNLLDNAVAACSDPARVVVRCAPALMDGAPAYQVSIHDNGPGFSPDQHTKVFEPFYTTKRRGTGLGLAICKRIVEAHGGRIETGRGPGGVVVMTLPAQ